MKREICCDDCARHWLRSNGIRVTKDGTIPESKAYSIAHGETIKQVRGAMTRNAMCDGCNHGAARGYGCRRGVAVLARPPVFLLGGCIHCRAGAYWGRAGAVKHDWKRDAVIGLSVCRACDKRWDHHAHLKPPPVSGCRPRAEGDWSHAATECRCAGPKYDPDTPCPIHPKVRP